MKWPRQGLLAAVAGLLVLAVLDPGWTGQHPVLDVVAVLDVTQSMNVADMPVEGDLEPVTRMARSRALLMQTMAQLSCGSRMGLGIFSEYRSLLLLAPVEVCEHYSELRATLAGIDSRMAWSGNSEIAKGVYSAVAAAKLLPSHPAVLFFTDGQEAPPLDPRYRPKFSGQVGEIHGLVVGVGGDQPVPIPRQDPEGRPIGTWGAADVMQISPRSGGRIGTSVSNEAGSDAGSTAAPALPGATPGREHLSSVREAYLQLLARETGLGYHRLRDDAGLRAALSASELAHEVDTRVSVRCPAAVLALLGLLWLYGRPLGAAARSDMPRVAWPRAARPQR